MAGAPTGKDDFPAGLRQVEVLPAFREYDLEDSAIEAKMHLSHQCKLAVRAFVDFWLVDEREDLLDPISVLEERPSADREVLLEMLRHLAFDFESAREHVWSWARHPRWQLRVIAFDSTRREHCKGLFDRVMHLHVRDRSQSLVYCASNTIERRRLREYADLAIEIGYQRKELNCSAALINAGRIARDGFVIQRSFASRAYERDPEGYPVWYLNPTPWFGFSKSVLYASTEQVLQRRVPSLVRQSRVDDFKIAEELDPDLNRAPSRPDCYRRARRYSTLLASLILASTDEDTLRAFDKELARRVEADIIEGLGWYKSRVLDYSIYDPPQHDYTDLVEQIESMEV